jgi:hypothetical protein
MCYVAYYPPNVLPEPEHLLNGTQLNPHGFGWVIGFEESYRGTNADIAVGDFCRARVSNCGVPAIFHARWATGDSPHSLANCQPLTLDDGTVLAHNGGLFPVDSLRSDTRVFAREYLPYWNLDSDAERTDLEQLIGWNKVVILRPGKSAVILNDQQGIWETDGSWHSNADYTGVSHLRAGQCGACGMAVAGAAAASLCDDCDDAYLHRREELEAAL